MAFIAGCASIEQKTPDSQYGIEKEAGIYHTVEKNQTLWRIAKMYNVNLQALIEANNMPGAATIKVGQRLFIPLREFSPKISSAEANFIWPFEGTIISYFGQIQNGARSKGILIKSLEDPMVKAVDTGTVCFTHPHLRQYGKTVIISHNHNFYSVYSNLSEILIKLNDNVAQGAIIAYAKAATDKNGTLLHFEVRRDIQAQDPLFFLPIR